MKLKVKKYNIDKIDKSGSFLITDEKETSSIWYDILNITNDGYDLDFSQYIFNTINSKDIEQQQLQTELLKYTDEVNNLIDEILEKEGLL